MSLVIFLGAIFFFVYPSFTKGRISFIDLFLLYCLYFDVTNVFTILPIYFSQNFLMLFFSVYYFIYKVKVKNKYYKKLLYASFFFLILISIVPILGGESLKLVIANFLRNYSSIIILPISFHYYSIKGKILNLVRSVYYFILIWMLVVIVFTFLKIDITGEAREGLGVYGFGSGMFYFGNMAARGAMTYISFMLLLVPLVYKYLTYSKKIGILFGSGFLLTIMLVALKRYAFITIILGFLNYISKSTVSLKYKLGLLVGISTIGMILIFNPTISGLMLNQYQARGAQSVYSSEAIEDDIRLYEPIYVIKDVFSGSLLEILFGKQDSRSIDINSQLHSKSDWLVHNQYAQYLLLYGLIGLFAYLYLFYSIYKMTSFFRKKLFERKIDVNEYWIVFQNLVLIFIAAGMVGGHVHITFRSIVLIFAGGISGYFYNLLTSNATAKKAQ
ncbi:MAG: hypothetical protein K9I95_14700 [Flavobacteriaceae bacterium]|nr:hypothetical protein [Flavobacteriaceae bacterium]